MGFAITDRLKLTLGERVAHTEFSLNHYADGYENYGPGTGAGERDVDPQYPQGGAVLPGRSARSLLLQAGPRASASAAATRRCRRTAMRTWRRPAFPNGAPLTYGSDNTQNFEVGAKNAFGNWLKVATSVYYIKWQDIQQNLYVAGACGLQFTDNLGDGGRQGL